MDKKNTLKSVFSLYPARANQKILVSPGLFGCLMETCYRLRDAQSLTFFDYALSSFFTAATT